jgi:SAM-dependent methyltransferase
LVCSVRSRRLSQFSSSRFADHFSSLADEYARFRPGYPPSLFAWLAGLAPSRRLAWDCATGPGQAAAGLARHFERVVATEASLNQLLQGQRDRDSRVRLVCSLAERSGLAPGSVDLLTVAQAVHWFDFDAFWTEVRRVLAPEGVVAVWGYGLLAVEPDPGGGLERLLDRYYRSVVGPYWPPERRHILERYRSIAFPPEEPHFEELQVPRVVSEAVWTRDHLLGYLGTWSAGKRYREDRGEDPRNQTAEELAAIWPVGERRRVRWELFVRVGRLTP